MPKPNHALQTGAGCQIAGFTAVRAYLVVRLTTRGPFGENYELVGFAEVDELPGRERVPPEVAVSIWNSAVDALQGLASQLMWELGDPHDPHDPHDRRARVARELAQGPTGRFALLRVIGSYPIADSAQPRQTVALADLLPSPPSPPPAGAPARPVWFELHVVDEIQEPVAEVPITFSHEGTAYPATTDADGVARIEVDGVSFAQARVTGADRIAEILAPRWRTLRASEPPPSAEALTIVTLDDQVRPQANLRAHQVHTLCILPPRLTIAVVEIEDATYHFDSSVFLPVTDSGTAAQRRTTGLDVIVAVLKFAKSHPEQSLLVAGHTDTSGADAYNEDLSERRACSAAWVLTGERAPWVDLAQRDHKTEDVQTILVWAATEFGWPCHPGPIDGISGSRTAAAIRGFQAAQAEHNPPITVDGVMGPQTWGAVFDTYMRGLVNRLDGDGTHGELQRHRAAVHFAFDDSPTLGCGEEYPIEAQYLDSYRSASNRRVEFLFFDPWELAPGLDAGTLCDEVYRQDSRFDREYIPIGGEQDGLVLRIVPDTWSSVGNILAYAEAVSGAIPPDVRTLAIGDSLVEHSWLAPDKRLYFVPPARPSATVTTVTLVEPGISCSLTPQVSTSDDARQIAASLRAQMRVLQGAMRARVLADRARGAPQSEVALRYKAVTDHADLRLCAALDQLETETHQGRFDPAVCDEIDAMSSENGRACDEHHAAVFGG